MYVCVCVQHLMNGAINLHRNNEISVADGLEEETQQCISVIQMVGAVPQQHSRGPAKNSKTLQFTDLKFWIERFK